MEVIARKGRCGYCGQFKIIEAPESLDQIKVDDIVTSHCQCIDARAAREEEERKKFLENCIAEAEKAIHQLFDDDWTMAAGVFISEARNVAYGDIKSITLAKEDGRSRGTISRKEDGSIKVTRKDSDTRVIG